MSTEDEFEKLVEVDLEAVLEKFDRVKCPVEEYIDGLKAAREAVQIRIDAAIETRQRKEPDFEHDGPPYHLLRTRVSTTTRDLLREHAKEHGVTMADVAREAVRKYMAK